MQKRLYIFNDQGILIGIKQPAINPKYNPKNPESSQYLWNSRTSILTSEEIDIPDGHTLQKHGDAFLIVKDLRGKIVYNTETKQQIVVDYVDEIKDGYTELVPTEFDVWQTDKWVYDIEQAKQAKTKEIKQAFINDSEGTIFSDAIQATIDFGRIHADNITRLLERMSETDVVDFRCSDKTYVYGVTKEQLQLMNKEMFFRGDALYKKKWALEDMVKVSTAQEELAQISWDMEV